MSDTRQSLIALTAILLIAPLSQSQVRKGSAPAVKLTPQQIQEAVNARLEGQYKPGPKVENPRATNSSIIGVLQRQKQAADLELQQISVADGSVRPAVSQARSSRGNSTCAASGELRGIANFHC